MLCKRPLLWEYQTSSELFFNCVPSAGSLSRSSLQESSGGKTQVVSFVSGIFLVISLLAIGPYFARVPKALLGAVIAVNLRGMFMQFHQLPPLWKYSKIDLVVWFTTFISVLIFGIDIGLLFGILALVFSSVFRNTRQTSELQGRIQSSEIFRPVSKYSTLTGNLVDHKIYRLKGSIDYASSETLLASLVQKGTIILDFGAVSYIDCIGRNELTKMFKKFDFVALCNVSEDSFLNLELGEIIDLENVKIYPTILDAIAMIDSISASTATSGISNESFTPV